MSLLRSIQEQKQTEPQKDKVNEPQITQAPKRPQLSPKENFLCLETYANELRKLARNETVHTALTYALAEYANTKPSAEKISGALELIDTFLNLAEPKSPPRDPFPDKRLKVISNDPPNLPPQLKK